MRVLFGVMAPAAEGSSNGNATKPREARGGAKVLLVDDRPVARLGLAELLSEHGGYSIVGESDGAPEVLDRVAELRPDVVILDISIRHGDGVELIKRLLARFPDLKILIFSMRDERYFAHRCLEAGAQGYVSKKARPEELVTALGRVLTGEIALSGFMEQRLLQHVVGRRPPLASGGEIDELSDRELEVFALLGEGMTTREIASDLELSIKTIESHRENIKDKLGLANNNELIRRAVEWVLERA